jgi:hypothetical protein
MNDPELPLRLAKYLKDRKEIGKKYRLMLEGLSEVHGITEREMEDLQSVLSAGMKWGDVIETDEGSLECVPSGSLRRGEPEMVFGKKLKYIPIREGETK